jgi:hypothetical protein
VRNAEAASEEAGKGRAASTLAPQTTHPFHQPYQPTFQYFHPSESSSCSTPSSSSSSSLSYSAYPSPAGIHLHEHSSSSYPFIVDDQFSAHVHGLQAPIEDIWTPELQDSYLLHHTTHYAHPDHYAPSTGASSVASTSRSVASSSRRSSLIVESPRLSSYRPDSGPAPFGSTSYSPSLEDYPAFVPIEMGETTPWASPQSSSVTSRPQTSAGALRMRGWNEESEGRSERRPRTVSFQSDTNFDERPRPSTSQASWTPSFSVEDPYTIASTSETPYTSSAAYPPTFSFTAPLPQASHSHPIMTARPYTAYNPHDTFVRNHSYPPPRPQTSPLDSHRARPQTAPERPPKLRPRTSSYDAATAPSLWANASNSFHTSTRHPSPHSTASRSPSPVSETSSRPMKALPKSSSTKKEKAVTPSMPVFVNLNASDAKKLLSGVAPSGSWKRKASLSAMDEGSSKKLAM